MMWKHKILAKWAKLNKKSKVIVVTVAAVILYIVVKGIL